MLYNLAKRRGFAVRRVVRQGKSLAQKLGIHAQRQPVNQAVRHCGVPLDRRQVPRTVFVTQGVGVNGHAPTERPRRAEVEFGFAAEGLNTDRVVHRHVFRHAVHHHGLEKEHVLVLRRAGVRVETEHLRDGATHAGGQRQALVRGAKPVEVKGVEKVGLVVPFVAGVGQRGGGEEGVDATEVVKAVGVQVASQLGVRHEEVAKQVDADFGVRIEEEALPHVRACGCVPVNGQTHPRRRRQRSTTRLDARHHAHDGLALHRRGVNAVVVELEPDLKGQPLCPPVRVGREVGAHGGFARPPRIGQGAKPNPGFVVEGRAVLGMAFQMQARVKAVPLHERRVEGCKGGVGEGRVEPVKKHLVRSKGGLRIHLFLAQKPRAPQLGRMFLHTSGQKARRARRPMVVDRRPPTAFARTEVGETGVEVGRAPRSDACTKVAAVQARQGFVDAQPCGFHGCHGGDDVDALGQQFVRQGGLLRGEGPCGRPRAQFHGVADLHLAVAHKRHVHA